MIIKRKWKKGQLSVKWQLENLNNYGLSYYCDNCKSNHVIVHDGSYWINAHGQGFHDVLMLFVARSFAIDDYRENSLKHFIPDYTHANDELDNILKEAQIKA